MYVGYNKNLKYIENVNEKEVYCHLTRNPDYRTLENQLLRYYVKKTMNFSCW